jgi:hypothetical protein
MIFSDGIIVKSGLVLNGQYLLPAKKEKGVAPLASALQHPAVSRIFFFNCSIVRRELTIWEL